ncbi:hypothetical protein HY493_02710 [Candidatus Woesearchaeota archaeon]|nr:hypothetical protein [Candidatus Woesearchaeota archaeon]
MKYLASVWKVFIGTFKLKMSFMLVLAYEVLFFLAVAGFSMLLKKWLISIGTKYSSISAFLVTPENAAMVKGFFFDSIVAGLGFVVLCYVAYVILQAFSWRAVVGETPSTKFILRFAGLNVIWLVPWLLIAWFFIAGLKGNYAAGGLTALVILFTHLTLIMQHASAHDNKRVKESVVTAFTVGFGRLHKFIVPYLFATILFIVWSQLWRLIPQVTTMGFAAVLLLCAIFAPFTAWLKFYIHKLLPVVA